VTTISNVPSAAGGAQSAPRTKSDPAGDTYAEVQNKASAQDGMKVVQCDYFSFGFGRLPPETCDDLEYNVYRHDGVGIEYSGQTARLSATGELLVDPLASRLERKITEVSEGRIKLYNQQKAAGKSNDEIKLALQDYDKALPDDYKKYIGAKDDPESRYDYPRTEILYG